MANLYEKNYAALEALLGRPLVSLPPGDELRLVAPGFLDLVVEVLPYDETGLVVVSLAHYFDQRGDLCKDPEMTMRLFHPPASQKSAAVPATGVELGRAEALSYEQSLPPICLQVYPEPGLYLPKVHREVNRFLALWLTNRKNQGHEPMDVDAPDLEA